MILKSYFFLLLLPLLFFSQVLHAQTDCQANLSIAAKALENGEFDRVRTAANRVADNEACERQSKVFALRLVSLSYIAEDELEEAQNIVRRILAIKKSFQPDPLDPLLFKEIILEVKEEMAYAIGQVVSVASKKAEPIQDAPGMITAYSNKDIEAYGYYTLSDLANLTPGYSSHTQYGEHVFTTRGQKAGSFDNNKHLLLIDGIPMNHTRANKALIEEELPLLFADRVEFLRGPASALYGISAFYGVVNVVPKTLSEDGTLIESKVSAGTRDHEKRTMFNLTHRFSGGQLNLSAGYYEKDASMDFAGVEPDSNYLFWDDKRTFFFYASHNFTGKILEGLSFGSVYMNRTSGLGEFWTETPYSHRVNQITWESLVPYLKYNRAFSDKVNVYGYLKGNYSLENGTFSRLNANTVDSYNGTGTPLQDYSIRSQNFEALAELRWNPTPSLSAVVGVNYDTRHEVGYPLSYSLFVNADSGMTFLTTEINRSDPFRTYSAYAQVQKELPILEGMILTLGVREDIGVTNANQYEQTSPRFGIVQRLTKRLNIKLLTGAALRAPGIKEVTAKNPDIELDAETVQGWEANVTYTTDKIQGAVAYFRNRTNSPFERNPATGQFQNSTNNFMAEGVELDLMFNINRKLRVWVNGCYALAHDEDDIQFQDTPSMQGNTAILYRLESKIKINSAFVFRWVEGYRKAETTTNLVKGHTVVDANFSTNITRNIFFEAQVRNIFGTKYFLPKNGQWDVPMPGRSFLGTLAVKF